MFIQSFFRFLSYNLQRSLEDCERLSFQCFRTFPASKNVLGSAGFFAIVSYIITVARERRMGKKFQSRVSKKPNPLIGAGEPFVRLCNRAHSFGVNALFPFGGNTQGQLLCPNPAANLAGVRERRSIIG